jgi:hypothetical protein
VKNAVIATLVALVIWLSLTVVRLENFHYAAFVGFCSAPNENSEIDSMKRYECLTSKETRTNPLWHLFYALFGRP